MWTWRNYAWLSSVCGRGLLIPSRPHMQLPMGRGVDGHCVGGSPACQSLCVAECCVYPTLSQALLTLFIRNIQNSVFEVGNFLRDPPIAVAGFWVCAELCCRYLLNSRVHLLSLSFVPLPLGPPTSGSALSLVLSSLAILATTESDLAHIMVLPNRI